MAKYYRWKDLELEEEKEVPVWFAFSEPKEQRCFCVAINDEESVEISIDEILIGIKKGLLCFE